MMKLSIAIHTPPRIIRTGSENAVIYRDFSSVLPAKRIVTVSVAFVKSDVLPKLSKIVSDPNGGIPYTGIV